MKKTILFPKIFLFFTALFFLNFSQAAEITLERVEPPFWWSGMKCNKLQLIVYGKNISETKVVINYPEVKLNESISVENPNYLFLNLEISIDALPGNFEIKFMKGEKIIQTYNYELKKRRKYSEERQGFNSSDVIYLLMPDRFANGDKSNDDVSGMKEKAERSNPNGRHGGDLKGIDDHLNYLKNLGITAIWINPVFENNMPKYSYHGYAITDFYKIDPRFGNNDDYVNLVENAHKTDIKVIMDMVFNHCGTGYWWENDLPMNDWYNQWPEFTRSNYRGGTVTDPYASEFDKNKMLKGWFDVTMADLNQNNKFLANYLIQNSIWWIEYADLDGIRMDTYPYSFKNFMAEWMKRINFEYPNFNVVGESWLPDPANVAYWQEGSNNEDGYESHLKNVFDFPLMYAISVAFNEKDDWNNGIVKLYDALGKDFLYGKPENLVIFPDNHDGDRFYTKVNENLDKYKLTMSFLATTRGIPEIYYGTEILMTGQEHKGHGDIRKDFPGGWEGDKADAFTKEGRSTEQNEAFYYLSNLLNWRKNKDVIHTGKLKHFIPENGVYVYFRYNDDESVMVILNNSEKEQVFTTERFAENLSGFNSGNEIISGKKLENLDEIIIPEKSAMIIELVK